MDKPTTRRERGVNQFEQPPLALQFAGLGFDELPVVPERPQRADVGPHAGAGDDIHFNAIFLQHLQHPDVREPLRSAAGERQADAATSDFTREPAQVELERHRPHSTAVHVERIHGGRRFAEIQMRGLADLLDEILRRLRHLAVCEAEHDLQVRRHATPRGAQLTVELVELKEAVHRLLGEHVGGGGTGRRLGQGLARRVRVHENNHLVEVAGAVPEESGEKRALGEMIRHPEREALETTEVLELVSKGKAIVWE